MAMAFQVFAIIMGQTDVLKGGAIDVQFLMPKIMVLSSIPIPIPTPTSPGAMPTFKVPIRTWAGSRTPWSRHGFQTRMGANSPPWDHEHPIR